MEGLGFMVWNLKTIMEYLPTPEQFGQYIYDNKIRWISWKISDGLGRHNQIGGNDKLLIDYMVATEQIGGATNGGWHYARTEKPGGQAGVIGERVAKFSNHVKFNHVMIDAEAEFKRPGLGGTIDLLLYIDVGKWCKFYLCSYRYPSYHPQINISRFMKHETISGAAPQMYWLGNSDPDDPAIEMDKSFGEYMTYNKEFIPIGCTFPWGTWTPSAIQLRNFVEHAISRRWYTYGFYSLDKILQLGATGTLWMEAITGSITPPPPPDQLPTSITTIVGANPRSLPIESPDTDGGAITPGHTFRVNGEKVNGYWPAVFYLHETVVRENQ